MKGPFFKVLALSLCIMSPDVLASESKNVSLLNNEKPNFSAVEARVIKVIDADTLKLEIYLWPGLVQTINVRSKGVDAPESLRPLCDQERVLAEAAKHSIEEKFQPGTWVYVDEVEIDKFGGRVVGKIDRWVSDRFVSVTEELLSKEGEWGVIYDGNGPKYDWCVTMPKAANDNG